MTRPVRSIAVIFVALFASTLAAAGRSTYPTAAVAADHELASQAGVEILHGGGNAVDAAVATSFALSVVRPFSCGIGGGGFMVIYLPDDPERGRVETAINYRETCPSGVGPETFVDLPPEASREGGLAVGVPGTVAGLLHALERYGTMERREVLEPAIRIARAGYERDAAHREASEVLEGRGGPLPIEPQARVLERIAELGRAGFYEGPVAEAVIRAVQKAGGVMTLEDLAGYEPRETEPLRFEFRGRTMLGMPPPSSGGVAIAQIFGFLERVEYGDDGDLLTSALGLHALAEAFKHAFAERAAGLGDAAFVDVPVTEMLSDERIGKMAGAFEPARTLKTEAYGDVGEPVERGGTSHFSIVDRWGGAVACTETINTHFGSLVRVEPFGFFLNNEMNDFTTRPGEPNAYGLRQSAKNLPEPGKRPLSSMSPTIALNDSGAVSIVAGASGGPRIITGTAQAMLRVILEDAAAPEAVAAPRLHHQWLPDRLIAEPAFDAGLIEGLRERGHDVTRSGGESVVQLIRRARAGEGWTAGSDPRKGGKPGGY